MEPCLYQTCHYRWHMVFIHRSISQQRLSTCSRLVYRNSIHPSTWKLEWQKQLLCKLHPGTTYETKAKLRYFDQWITNRNHGRRSGGALSPPPPFVSKPSYHPYVSRLLWEINSVFRKKAMFTKHTAMRIGRID